MLEVLFSFLVHTFSGGLSRVALAMSSPNRSRSSMRTTSVHDDKAEEPKENPDAPTQVGLAEKEGLPEAPVEGERKDSKDANDGSRGELATPAEEAAGKQLLEASASCSLTTCVQELEKNCNLLSDVKDSAVALESLAAGVNYYASTTKAANSSQAQAHKQIQWDWLSSAPQCVTLSKASRRIVRTRERQATNLSRHSDRLLTSSRTTIS